MLGKINIKKLVKQHLDTLYDNKLVAAGRKKKVSGDDVFTFLIFPSILSILLVSLGVYFTTEKYVDIAIKSLSLFTGLLFSLLVLVYNLGKKENEDLKKLKGDLDKDPTPGLTSQLSIEKTQLKLTIIKELFSNIAFAILVAIICIVLILATQLKLSGLALLVQNNFSSETIKFTNCIYFSVINFLALLFVVEFLFVLFMILKRFNLLFNSEFNDLN